MVLSERAASIRFRVQAVHQVTPIAVSMMTIIVRATPNALSK
jgi:hypothetical protein